MGAQHDGGGLDPRRVVDDFPGREAGHFVAFEVHVAVAQDVRHRAHRLVAFFVVPGIDFVLADE
ncbi:hypothetical protein D3C77_718600 [compost metagenome]